MAKFIFGFAVAVIVLPLAGFCYVRFGFMDPRADIPVNSLESKIGMPSLDAAVDRRAPETPNSIQPTDENLLAGMKIYQTNCASCHGDVNRPHGMLAESLYPRAPQFLEDAPDMPENQNFFIVQHGIRMSGMPAWKEVLSEQQIWQVITFLGHMDKLPPQISDAWKNAAGGSTGENPTTHASPMNMKDNPDCALMEFVPALFRRQSAPCRFIPLVETRETSYDFYQSGTQMELEEALACWLRRQIQLMAKQQRNTNEEEGADREPGELAKLDNPLEVHAHP